MTTPTLLALADHIEVVCNNASPFNHGSGSIFWMTARDWSHELRTLAAPQVEMVSDEMVGDAIDAFNAEAVTGEEFLLSKRAGIRMKAALQAALNARAGGDGWLPIESAPESSDFMLSDVPDCLVYGPEIRTKMGRARRYPDGRVEAQAYGFHGEWEITHWQPLPTPPAALASQAVGVNGE